MIEKLKALKAQFDELSLAKKVVLATVLAVVLSALGFNLSAFSFIVGLL